MFSYILSADQENNNKIFNCLNNYIERNIINYSKKYIETEDSLKNFLSSIVIENKVDNSIKVLDYNEIKQAMIRNDINYKNSFVNLSYEVISNPVSIFSTITLGSSFHPFKNNKINCSFFDDIDFELLESFETDEEKNNFLIDFYDFKVLKGYFLLQDYERNFYKQRVFRNDKLNNNERSRITAVEPHKSQVAHQHKLEIINGDFLLEYLRTFIKQHSKFQLGRSELAIFKKDFEKIKNDFDLELINSVNNNDDIINEYKIIGTEHKKDEYIYIKVLIAKNDNEIQSISNYLTNYIENTTIVSDDNDENFKKSSVKYHGWAYYIANLKDKFYPKEDNVKYKKIRRIRYSQLLISKEVYNKIFTKELKNIFIYKGVFQKHNMYSVVTSLLLEDKMQISRIYAIDKETRKPDKTKVMYYLVYYDGLKFLINNVKYFTFFRSGTFTYTEFKRTEQIDLNKDDYYIERYFVDRINEEDMTDNDFSYSDFSFLNSESKFRKMNDMDVEFNYCVEFEFVNDSFVKRDSYKTKEDYERNCKK